MERNPTQEKISVELGRYSGVLLEAARGIKKTELGIQLMRDDEMEALLSELDWRATSKQVDEESQVWCRLMAAAIREFNEWYLEDIQAVGPKVIEWLSGYEEGE
jgi:hypothetical protein